MFTVRNCDASKEGVPDISGGGRSDTYGESTVGKGGENCKGLENKEFSRCCTLPKTWQPSAGAEAFALQNRLIPVRIFRDGSCQRPSPLPVAYDAGYKDCCAAVIMLLRHWYYREPQ